MGVCGKDVVLMSGRSAGDVGEYSFLIPLPVLPQAGLIVVLSKTTLWEGGVVGFCLRICTALGIRETHVGSNKVEFQSV